MTKLLLTQYRLEYETTDITKDELISKYSIDPTTLKGHEDWIKPHQLGPEDYPSQELVTVDNRLTTKEVKASVKDNISEFKELAMEHCLTFMKNDVRFAEVKEFKDIVSIVTSIESSGKDDTTGTTINVLVQNITEGFRDDC